MANNTAEITFEDFEINEHFKKKERSLKLAVLRKAHNKIVHNREMLPNWPSISTINMDTANFSCVPSSMQASMIKSEVLASSNNLKNLCLTKRNYKTNQEIIATSSIKQDDRHVMPPPMRNSVYRTFKETQNKSPTLQNYEISSSLNRSIQSSIVNTFNLNAASYISTNSNTNKEDCFVAPITPTNDSQKINRIFSRWRVMLNDNCELIIKGTLECGKVAHSKPIIRRYTATCIESKYKHKYNLQGNIFDERNALPDYIRGKFYNGFPDDWENVYQIWRTYVSRGCPVTFRWPTPITDSDDDLKSEVTELAYIHTKNSNTILTKTYKSIGHTESEIPSDKSSKKEEKYYNCPTRSFQNNENTSFVKPLISDFEKDTTPMVQTRNIKLAYDEHNKQNTELDTNSVYSSRGINKLKDVICEDKLNIIINNLMDKNCSPNYVKKIIEMFDCMDYVVSYRTKSECNDSVVSANPTTSSKSETILQPSLMCADNRMNTNKSRNEVTSTEQEKNYTYSTDLRRESIKSDFNSNPINIRPEQNKNYDSDESSESEIYAGVPKISIERVLHARKASRKIFKHKMKKKPTNSQCNAKGIEYDDEFESPHVATPITNKKNLPSDKPCLGTDEVKAINTKKCHETVHIAQRSQKDIFCSNPEIQRNNCDVYGANKPAIQDKQLLNAFEAQRDYSSVFTKDQKVQRGLQENAHSQFVADIDYIDDSDIDVTTVSTNTRKTDGNMIALHSNPHQGIVVISSENNNNFEKPFVIRRKHREFIEQPKNEIATKKAKPNIISSMPVNLKLKIKKADSKPEQLQSSDVNIVENEEAKQYSNIQPLEEVHKKKFVSKTDNKKEIYPTTNKKNKSNTNLTKPMANPTIEQSESNELEIVNNIKVLSAWMPKVIYHAKSKSELGLTFEGKLLNEFDHIVHRKFTTDIVLKRLSATLIETVNHEVYKLLGCLNDNKHVIPKEIAKQCRNGCPTNIEQFCLTWKMLESSEQKMKEKLNNNGSMDSLNTSISSRGRRIVPVLSYWTGERISLKDNNLVYNPGSSQESSLISNTEETERKQNINYKNTSKDEKLLSTSNETPGANKSQTIVIRKTQSSNKSPKTTVTNSTKRVYKSNKRRKSQIKQHVKQSLTFSSTESSEEEHNIPPSKRMRTTRLNTNTEAPSQYTMTLRKRHKVETTPNEVSYRSTTKPQ